MSSPKHLWSGDWERESALAAADRADHPASPVADPVEPPRVEPPSSPGRPSALARVLAGLRSVGARLGDLRLPRVRRRQRRLALLVGLAALVIAGGAFALGSSGGSVPGRANASTPWLGLQLESLPVDRVLVAAVVPGSPADRAGLGVGDLILGINGKAVKSPGDVDSALAGLRPGTRVQLRIGRGSSTFSLPATLTTRPASYP